MIRQAVITVNSPAAMKRLLGLSILKRAILAAHQAGIERFLLMPTGNTPIDLQPIIQDRGLRKRGIDIQPLDPGHPSPNLATTEATLILPGTLVFTPASLAAFIETDLPEGGVNVMTDDARNFSGMATISAPGLPKIVGWLLQNRREPGLQDLEAIVSQENSRLEVTVAHHWADADSKAGFLSAREILLQTARKKEDGFVARHVNRHISLACSRLLLRFDITPTAVTIVNLMIGLGSGYFIGKGGYINSLLGGFLFQCASIFDGCDGEIARLTHQCSELGTKIDNISDILTLIVFMVNLPIGIFNSTQNPAYLYLGAVMLISVALVYFQIQRHVKKSQLTGSIVKIVKDIESEDRVSRAGFVDRVAAKIAFIFRHDFIKMGIFLLAALDGRIVILWILILLSPLEFIYLGIYSRSKLEVAIS